MSDLESVVSSVKYLHWSNPLDAGIVVCDANGIVVQFLAPKTYDFKVIVGEKISNNDPIMECLITKRPLKKLIPKEIYGFTIKLIISPIFKECRIVGAIQCSVKYLCNENDGFFERWRARYAVYLPDPQQNIFLIPR